MEVKLINYTQDAEDVLLFTKSTRLALTPGLLDEIKSWPRERKLAELAYMANTIPSSWEFVDYTFAITGVSRAFTHQFVRNRHGSYAQQSMRVVGMNDFDYVWPRRLLDNETLDAAQSRGIIQDTNAFIKESYRRLIRRGIPAEDARGILPTNIATNIVAKFNLRTMSELAKSRTGGRTQGEYITVTNAMCDEVLRVHPWAEQFLFPHQRNAFDEIEEFAERAFGGDLLRKGELLKIVDRMRKAR